MRLHINELPLQLAIALQAGINMGVVSKPAIGKTETIAAAAATFGKVKNVEYWPFDATTMTPNDLAAWMPNLTTGKLDAYPNGALPNAYDNPDQCGILFIDEMLNADPQTGKIFQKYTNGEDIGGKLRKPKGVIVVWASNRLGDRAGVMQQSRALLSRSEQWEVYSTPDHNTKFADKAGFFPIVVEFFKRFPDLIDNYEIVFEIGDEHKKLGVNDRRINSEEGKRGVWANMRAWKRLSDVELACQLMHKPLHPLRAQANLGQAVGMQYGKFRAEYDGMATIEDILTNPKKVELPDRLDKQYVTLAMLASLVPFDKLAAADKFLDRIGGDLRMMCIKRMLLRAEKDRANFDLESSAVFKSWVSDPGFVALLSGKA